MIYHAYNYDFQIVTWTWQILQRVSYLSRDLDLESGPWLCWLRLLGSVVPALTALLKTVRLTGAPYPDSLHPPQNLGSAGAKCLKSNSRKRLWEVTAETCIFAFQSPIPPISSSSTLHSAFLQFVAGQCGICWPPWVCFYSSIPVILSDAHGFPLFCRVLRWGACGFCLWVNIFQTVCPARLFSQLPCRPNHESHPGHCLLVGGSCTPGRSNALQSPTERSFIRMASHSCRAWDMS